MTNFSRGFVIAIFAIFCGKTSTLFSWFRQKKEIAMQSRVTIKTNNMVSVRASTRTAAWTIAAALMVLGTVSRLSAGVVPPVWTCDTLTDETSNSTNMVKELKPIKLVGARNGSFSGKIVVESTKVIKGLQASVSALSGKGTAIPVSNVQLRYGSSWLNWYPKSVGPNHMGTPFGLDILNESPVEPVLDYYSRAMEAVWVTVKVPTNAKAGTYTGEVTVKADGIAAVHVPLSLDVQDWTLPDPQDYRTWSDIIQSPDTLALEYNVPLWSEQHWKLIDRSFKLLSPNGGRVVYVPLLCRMNFGNEQSMVRWIKKGENQYEYDYTVLDKYLDSAEKNLGKPKIVVFAVWDIYLSAYAVERGNIRNTEAVKQARLEVQSRGPRVTSLNPATKEASIQYLPRYEDATSKALWQPMFAEIRKRMAKRGLEKTMMLGMSCDLLPTKEEVTFWKEVSGDLPWVNNSHHAIPESALIPGSKGMKGIAEVGYAAFGVGHNYNVNLNDRRMYGWKIPVLNTSFIRMGILNYLGTPIEMHELFAFDITGGHRGQGRMGGDYWWAVRKKNGEPSGAVPARYPEDTWHDMDIDDFYLAPGPDGAVATARLEYMKEGIQICEARIFLEDALLDEAKKARIGADLAKRCQDALDEHHHAMCKTIWNNDEDLNSIHNPLPGCMDPAEWIVFILDRAGKLPKDGKERNALIASEVKKGQAWYLQGRLEREKKLFALSGEVAAKLDQQK